MTLVTHFLVVVLISAHAVLGCTQLQARPSTAAPLWVDAARGSDGPNGNGTADFPWRSLAHGMKHTPGGGLLYVRDGTYNATTSQIEAMAAGTAGAYTTVSGAPGHHSVVLVPAQPGNHVLGIEGNRTHHVTFANFTIEATGGLCGVKITDGGSGGAAHHIRIENCEIRNAPSQGVLTTDGAEFNEFVGLDVHHNGWPCPGMSKNDFCHGFYISTSNNVVSGCTMHDNAGWGIQLYDGDGQIANNTVEKSVVHDNAAWGQRGPGIGVYCGPGHCVENNLVFGNAGGIQVRYGAADALIQGNTVFNNTKRDGNEIGVVSGVSGTVVSRNIIYDSNAHGIRVGDGATRTTVTNNVLWNCSTAIEVVVPNETVVEGNVVW